MGSGTCFSVARGRRGVGEGDATPTYQRWTWAGNKQSKPIFSLAVLLFVELFVVVVVVCELIVMKLVLAFNIGSNALAI